jgi:hydroxymethylglutaryl-CoA reductase
LTPSCWLRNDFRAVEAGIHAYAAKSGQYSVCPMQKLKWHIYILARNTVGSWNRRANFLASFGISLEMLENPSARELMQVVAVAGLANFAALRSLTTTGIQDGHMKMHLNNILNQFDVMANGF